MLRRRSGMPGDRLWMRERFAAHGHWRVCFDAGKNHDVWSFVHLTLASGHAWRFDRTRCRRPMHRVRP